MIDVRKTPAPGLPPSPVTVAGIPFLVEESIGYQMRRIVCIVASEIERRMEPLGLTDAQWKPLLRLYLKHENTVAGLARLCQLDAGGMTRLLDRLEAKGLCTRTRSLEDRRVVHIELTPEGHAAAAQIPDILGGVQQICAQGFQPAEYRQLQDFLQRIHGNLQALGAAADTGTPSLS
ncbi:MarR family winged helix-turn-helix transcriptional regulator [Paracidovorax valerianellae]|uniref:DNA-binding transcriptional regulator, MarR family n=1 Tax=Paracidovorax valerianellae TaxID=187868 RepID=A0A1G7DYY7_9BURK|nr:MarR family transcriptional regulator [Paracidovorax valerianellae]MDA8444543.1 MarR family transcriptional regulator [Paracidovorax valerianellae]SDE56470.1 DNA-binding transcriptional regulator, MarR family [Paracidovorax valerianellae]